MFQSRRWIVACIPILCAGLAAAQTGDAPAAKDNPAKTAPKAESASTAPTKAAMAQSQNLFRRAMRLSTSESSLPEAFGLLEESVSLDPTDMASVTAREFVRQELVSEHLERGNAYMDQSRPVEALAEFRQAFTLDPTNAFTQQRMKDAAGSLPRQAARPTLEFATEQELAPRPGKQDFIFRGDSRQLITNISRAFGISVTFDASYAARQVKTNLEKVDFQTALNIACQLSRCFYIAVSPKEMIIANDSQDVRRSLERQSLRTFYVPAEAGGQALPEITNILRTILDLRFIVPDISQNTITIRAPKETLDAAAMLIDSMTAPRPQVLLEIRALRLDESSSRQIGIVYPLQFTVFNLNTEAAKLGSNAQDLISRFLAGTLTPADLVAAQALLASGALSNSPLLKKFATFGGGTTKSGVVIPPGSINFSMTHSLFTSLQHASLRASQGLPATFRVGDRYPVITQSFSSLLSGLPSRNGAQNLLQPIVPAISYEDLGITLKATPIINAEDVTMQLELTIKELAGVSLNDIPTISNREYKGTITVRDGETTVLAGTIDKSEQKSSSGLPWLAGLPGVGRAFSNNSRNATSDELLLLVTPHILQTRPDMRTEMELKGN